jgi:hypothetical protein
MGDKQSLGPYTTMSEILKNFNLERGNQDDYAIYGQNLI